MPHDSSAVSRVRSMHLITTAFITLKIANSLRTFHENKQYLMHRMAAYDTKAKYYIIAFGRCTLAWSEYKRLFNNQLKMVLRFFCKDQMLSEFI